jgi:hypothetical protein
MKAGVFGLRSFDDFQHGRHHDPWNKVRRTKVGDVESGSSSDNPETPLFVEDNDSELWVSEVVRKKKC